TLGQHKLLRRQENLFVTLMKEIAQELNVTSCWICGGVQMTEQWPWRGEGLTPDQLLEWNRTESLETKRSEGWVLSNDVIGQEFIERKG
ncbi:ENR1 protein, partial [Crypturellus undulatus]|nr:ENR1 protein [Crypturellus undulatus]